MIVLEQKAAELKKQIGNLVCANSMLIFSKEYLERIFRHYTKELLEIIDQLIKSQKWQPIKTAPKYSSSDQAAERTILLLTKQGQVVEGYWTPNGKEWIAIYYYDKKDKRTENIFNGFVPTHWMNKPSTSNLKI